VDFIISSTQFYSGYYLLHVMAYHVLWKYLSVIAAANTYHWREILSLNALPNSLTEDSSLCERSPQQKGTTAPENTPTSATGSDWSIKKQRKSVAEAEQMALVKTKVALFESYRSASTHKRSSPSTVVSDPVSAIAITPKKSIRLTPSKSASDSPSTASYHAVFPGLNLGETMTLASTSARSFQISVSRIPEEAEDEGAGEETSREVRGAAGATFNAGKPFCGALQESPRLRQSLQPSLGLPEHHAPKTLEAARGGPGPGGAGGCTTPDQPLTAHHITRAMKGLHLTESPESSSIEPGKGSDKGKLGGGGEGGGLIETGPAPIIECNGSGVHPLEGTRPASHCGSGAGGVGGFLGIVQKTLGLSWQCAALPPTHTSAINTMASSTSPPLEPLPPLDPADTYLMSDSDEEGRPLGEDVVGSDEEAWDRRRRSAKKVRRLGGGGSGAAVALRGVGMTEKCNLSVSRKYHFVTSVSRLMSCPCSDMCSWSCKAVGPTILSLHVTHPLLLPMHADSQLGPRHRASHCLG
jgi:hypothetical protein